MWQVDEPTTNLASELHNSLLVVSLEYVDKAVFIIGIHFVIYAVQIS